MLLTKEEINSLATEVIRIKVGGIGRNDVKNTLEGGGPLAALDDAEYEAALDQITKRIEDAYGGDEIEL